MRNVSMGWMVVGFMGVVLTAFLAATAGANEARLPNFVFVLADDLGIGDPGCYNKDSKIPTPHLDRLAAEGMQFTDAHSGSAVCSPTRYGVLTGRYAWRSRLKQGVLWGYSRALIEPKRLTVAELLRRRGYATACVGKWHLGFQSPDLAAKDLPAAHAILPGDDRQAVDYLATLRPGPLSVGFDYFFGIPASLDMEPYVFVENDRVVEAPTAHTEKSLHRRQGGNGFWREGPIAPSFRHQDVLPTITQKAVAWLNEQSAEKPFLLYFPLTAPHTPWVPNTEFQGRTAVGHYGDFVSQVDAVVGRIMETLAAKGLAENTLLIVTSDNGSHWPVSDVEKWGHDANLGYRGQKADIWEAGHRVPFLVRWPGRIRPAAVCDETICLVDFLATAAEIVGAELPDDAGEDSFSLLPALLEEDRHEPIRPATVHHSSNGTFALRQGDWKLVVDNLGSGGFTAPQVVKPKPGEAQGQLYNLKQDPAETTNLHERRPDVAERLRRKLQEIQTAGRSRKRA